MKKFAFTVVAIAAISACPSVGAATVVADFDTPVITSSANVLGYSEEGFRFDYIRSFVSLVHVAPDRTDLYNGSQTLYDRFGGGMIIQRQDGNTFTPITIGIDGNDSSAPALLFEGCYENGDSFTQVFFGNSGLGLETVTFDNSTAIPSGIGFNEIIRLEMTPLAGAPFQIDNFTAAVAAIPEPSSAALLGLGAIPVAFARRRRGTKA